MGRPKTVIAAVLAVCLLAAIGGATAAAPPATPPPASPSTPGVASTQPQIARGPLHFKCDQRSPQSDIKILRARLGGDGPPLTSPDYDLSQDSFEGYVPTSYDPAQPCGLLVWVAGGDSGQPPKEYLDVFEKQRLIWAAANKSGNQRHPAQRIGLALDAANYLRQRYTIDPDRIYIGGATGGGRMASCIGLLWGDVFSGSLAMQGCNFYRKLPLDTPGKVLDTFFPPPPAKVLQHDKDRCRYVLVTGENNAYRAEFKACYEEGYFKDQFKFVTLIEAPKTGPAATSAQFLDQAIAKLDAPLGEWKKQVTAGEPPEHIDPTHTKPADKSPGAADAREHLGLARNYLQAGATGPARTELELVIKQWPDSPQAAEAKSLLEELPQ